MRDSDPQVSLAGLAWTGSDGISHSIMPDSPAWYAWLADPAHGRLLFAHPTLGRFILRHERKQRGGWYWSMYHRLNGRLRKSYLGKGEQLSLQKLQSAAYALGTGTTAPDMPAISQLSSPVPLLAAKLTPPPLRPRAVTRPRLLDQLLHAIERPLTLVTAPAGSGKTSLLAAWLQQIEPRTENRSAWLSLDTHDNDPARFLAYLCAACERLHPAVGAVPLGLLQAPQPVAFAAVLTPLLNGLGAATGTFVLVLDDYHLITNPTIHEAMRFIIDHQPPNLRLVIAGRSEPPLLLPRLRARGQLSEIQTADLRFNSAEAHQFLSDSMGLVLSPEQAAVLEQRAEGWAAGLYLAALVASRHGRGFDALAEVSGSQRAIVDYLATEVLADQPEPVQRFLLLSSMLDRLCGPLCDAILHDETENPDRDDVPAGWQNATLHSAGYSQSIIEQLDRANLFLVPLDAERRWYRYHQLFGDFLRDQLERTAPERLPELHRRAALWYAEEGLLVEAIGHGLGADATLAAELVERYGRDMLMRSAVTTVLEWIERLPAKLVTSRPHLGLIAAWALTAAGRLDAAALRLDAVEALLGAANTDQGLTGEVLAVRAAIAGLRRDLPATAALCQAALARLSPTQGYVRSVVSQLLGGAAYASGDAHGASMALAEALQFSQASGNLFITAFSTRQLADVRVMQGRITDAERLYRQVVGLDASHGSELPGLPVAGMAAVGLGELYYRRNDFATATGLIDRGLAAGERGQDIEILVRGNLALARVRAAQGNVAATNAALARASAAATNGTIWLDGWVQAEAARCAVLTDDLAAALAWAHSSNLSLDDAPSYLYEINYLILARITIARATAEGHTDQLQAVEQLLARLHTGAEQAGRVASQVEIATLEAQTLHAIGDGAAAAAALERALRLGHPDDYARIYLDGGAAVGALLWRLLRGGTLPVELRTATNKLLSAFSGRTAYKLADSPELLTAREREVMRLVAAGRTNQQIAQALVVSVSTIKKHLGNLYGKLGASNRTEALARARELGVVA